MSENLSSQEIKRAAELANLANQVYQDNGGKPGGGWEKVVTSEEVSSIPNHSSEEYSGYYGAVYKKPDGTYDSQGKPNYEYALVHRGTDEVTKGYFEDLIADIKTAFDILPEDQFKDANRLLNQAKSMDPQFSDAVSHGEVVNVGHSLGGLLAKLFGAAMGSNEIVAYNSPGGKHLLNDAAEYWDELNHNDIGTTNLSDKDYSNTVKEINAWGDPVSKIGGFGIGKEYDLSQGQSLLGSLLLDNPFSEAIGTSLGVGTLFGAKTFHSMENLEKQLNGDAQKLINDAETKNAPLNVDGTVNLNLINNSNLDLSIRTDLKSGYISNNDTTQTGNAIGGADWEAKMKINVINADGFKNIAMASIVSDYYRPGNQETSTYQNFAKDFSQQVSNLDKVIYNNSQTSQNLFNNTQLNVNLSNLTNNTIGARTFVNIDPVVLDLNGDGVKLTSYNDSEVTFDVDNDGKRERTGWVSKEDGILVEDQNNNDKIDNITETISEYYNPNDGSVADADGKYSTDGLAALKKLDSNHDGKFNLSDAKWNDLKVWVDANGDAQTDVGELKTLTEAGVKEINLSMIELANKERNAGNIIFSKSTYTTISGETKQVAAVDFTTNPIGYEFNDVNLGKLATAEDGTKSLVIKNENGETVIAGSDVFNWW